MLIMFLIEFFHLIIELYLLYFLNFILTAIFADLFFIFLLLFAFLLIVALRECDLALHLIIIFEDIANEFAISYIKIPLLNPDGLDEPSPAVLISLLILLDFSICLFYMGKPLHHFPCPYCSAKDIDACVGCHFQSDARQFLSIHMIYMLLNIRIILNKFIFSTRCIGSSSFYVGKGEVVLHCCRDLHLYLFVHISF